MPHPLTRDSLDDYLDNMQKQLSHSLATRLIERGVLDEFSEQLEGIDEETLKLMMHYPITLTMLSQDYFRQNGYPKGWEAPDPLITDQSHESPINYQLIKRTLNKLAIVFKQIMARLSYTFSRRG